MSDAKNSSAIILFDGVCNFCNSKINLVLRNDKHNYFRFAPLQSAAAENLKKQYHILHGLDSVILIENNRVYYKSTAALLIARKLNFPVNCWYGFILVPAFLRNWVYSFIARRRYHLWGKRETCMLPTAEYRARFLD